MKYLLIITLALLLTACSRANYQHLTSKKILQEELNQSAESNTQIRKEERETASSNEDTESKTVVVEFDTDKPTDPQTGLPPIKSVAITDTQKKGQNTSERITDTRIQEAIQENTTLATNQEVEMDVEKETKAEVLKPPSFLKAMIYILAIVGFYFLHDWIRENWSKIKEIWKK